MNALRTCPFVGSSAVTVFLVSSEYGAVRGFDNSPNRWTYGRRPAEEFGTREQREI
jgi:hypothetical protein